VILEFHNDVLIKALEGPQFLGRIKLTGYDIGKAPGSLAPSKALSGLWSYENLLVVSYFVLLLFLSFLHVVIIWPIARYLYYYTLV
jgi:hypothetical protein